MTKTEDPLACNPPLHCPKNFNKKQKYLGHGIQEAQVTSLCLTAASWETGHL